jgi:hypothetical protein
MRLDVVGVRYSILVALGLVACGPSSGSNDGDGSGSNSADGGSDSGTSGSDDSVSASESVSASASASDSVSESASVSVGSDGTDDGTGSGGGCDVAPPPGVEPPTCADPIAITQESASGPVPSGLEQCADGRVHRIEAVACEYPATIVGTCSAGVPEFGCLTDADCTDAPHGYCNMLGGLDPSCACSYGCASDADCGAGEICMCDGPESRCVAADCTTDADCDGWACARGHEPSACGSPPAFFACESPFDGCNAAAGCDPESCAACLYQPENCSWACVEDDEVCADCGRPFLVDGIARTAELVARGDWTNVELDACALDPIAAPALADHWQRCALAEHASIAAFARYTLDLLALAAPATLVNEAQRAMGDEIRHAQACFALASRYAGSACGPGPLASDGALAGRDRLRILDDVVREGCIGETLAAIEAGEALAHARDPVVREVLATIARDEQRHAELAWRHVAWELAEAGADERAAIIAIVERAIADAELALPASTGREPDLRAHGVLTGGARREAVRRGLALVVRPCARAMFEATLGQRVGDAGENRREHERLRDDDARLSA